MREQGECHFCCCFVIMLPVSECVCVCGGGGGADGGDGVHVLTTQHYL